MFLRRLALVLGNRQQIFGMRSWNKSTPSTIYHAQELGCETMFKNGKAALIVAIALSAFGASAAYAAGHDRWEGKIGPLGQCFTPPNCGQERQGYQSGQYGFANVSANLSHHHRDWYRTR
jgi:hypothetical protein